MNGMLGQFLSIAESTRAEAVLRRLAQHRIDSWALTGGLAVGIHSIVTGLHSYQRSLSDLDFITERFEDVPKTLGKDFLFRHVHPGPQHGRIMMQLVDADAQLRIDLFHAAGATLERASQIELAAGKFTIVALEDLMARTARLLLDLASGLPVPAKHAADFLLLSGMVGSRDVQPAWRDHRKPDQPESFTEVTKILSELIPKKRELLVIPEYSQDTQTKCDRCMQADSFPLADPHAILAVLGYC